MSTVKSKGKYTHNSTEIESNFTFYLGYLVLCIRIGSLDSEDLELIDCGDGSIFCPSCIHMLCHSILFANPSHQHSRHNFHPWVQPQMALANMFTYVTQRKD